MNRCILTIEKEIQDHEGALCQSTSSFEMVEENPPYIYRNMFFVYDGYDSLLNSGLFTYFKVDTQDRLTNLYASIKAHNRVVEARDVVRTHFFMDGEYSEERITKWKNHIKSHDIILYKYQKEIQAIMEDVKKLINEEKESLR
jgi:hypothetical protein